MGQTSGNGGKREVVVDSDWLTTIGMVALLVLSVLFAVFDFRRIVHADFNELVSIDTVILVILFFYLAYLTVERLLKAGLLLIAFGASIRAVVFYVHASDKAQFFAATVSVTLDVIGWTVIVVYAAQWFRTVISIRHQQ